MSYDNRLGQMAGLPEAARNYAPPADYPHEKMVERAPASIIDVQMGHLDSRIDVMQKLAAVLESKLGKVLRQADQPNVNRGNLTSPTPNTGVILGDALAMQSERLQDAINYLNNTIERIEL